MGTYSEYIEKMKSFLEITTERKRQLKRISQLRGNRDILVIASDVQKQAPISIDYSDILPIKDQIENLNTSKLDVILETPGGSAEVAEDIVKLLRGQFKEIGFIIPGIAKSAGTIIVMAGDEILMEPASALGPIDAQIVHQGKVFSADAFIEGLDKIKEEVKESGYLNKAYIPILQGISPGEIQKCVNALDFSKTLVSNWLAQYKFKNWLEHSSTGQKVTDDERKKRAEEIATKLCAHGDWLTHGRSIKIEDLVDMKLLITDYSKDSNLFDAIKRYYTLLRMSFDTTNMFKLFETPSSQIYRFSSPIVPVPPPQKQISGEVAMIDFVCQKCTNRTKLQANLGKKRPIQEGAIPFPSTNTFNCPHCGTESNLASIRNQIEAQTKKKIV